MVKIYTAYTNIQNTACLVKPEREIEKILVREVRRAGGEAYKFVSPGHSGVPDRIVMMPGGKVYFVELKTAKGVLLKQQARVLEQMMLFGQKVSVVFGVQGLHDFLQHIGADVIFSQKLLDKGEV